ncbi:MAG: thioredoxin fold domain-containing protein [Planctomycetes bacterium]|nr:thioredoxin fold domain-containing protein [Planctomycetota bacterium]
MAPVPDPRLRRAVSRAAGSLRPVRGLAWASRTLLLVAALLAGGCSEQPPAARTSPAATATSPWFDGPFEDALAQARASRTLVFVDFFTTWCPPCKKLDAETFSQPAVQAELRQLVALKIDAESQKGVPLARQYRVGGYPTLLVLDAAGTEVGRMVGFLPPERFLEKLAEIRARAAR